MRNEAYAQAIEEHYMRNWATPTESIRWGQGPIKELPSEFRVLIFPRSHSTLAFATQCMSLPEDQNRVELHLLTRVSGIVKDSLVELLTAVAHYHRTGNNLQLGDSVNFGRPWLPGSKCTHGLISLPYLDGPKLEWLEEPRTRFLWLIPITPEELKCRTDHGTDYLEEQFELKRFDYLDPVRDSVV